MTSANANVAQALTISGTTITNGDIRIIFVHDKSLAQSASFSNMVNTAVDFSTADIANHFAGAFSVAGVAVL